MGEKKFDVYGVGNAIVDILSQVDESAISDLSLAKSSMTLMDTEKQSGILHFLEGNELKMASGGSAANTLVALAQSGASGIFAGKVAHDMHGEFYKKDMIEAGIDFYVEMAPQEGLPTGTCVVLTTPDAERTMCTHLGVSTALEKSDIDPDRIALCEISYIEGYLWDAEKPRAACVEAFEQSKKLGVKAAFTFSDAFLLGRFADDFKQILTDYVDIVFCNSDEVKQFYGSESLDDCIEKIGKQCNLAFVTDGANGCHVVEDGNVNHVAGFPVKAIDTVGAGDAFAGGTLYGLTHGLNSADSARWGNYIASRVVEHIGPRLEISLKEHIAGVVAR